VTVKPLTVNSVAFTASGDVTGTGTENDPYVLYVGNALRGTGSITMSDDKVYENQRLSGATVTPLIAKSTKGTDTLDSSVVARYGTVTLTAKAEGLVKVTLKSVSKNEEGNQQESDPIYVKIVAPVTELALTSSDIIDNKFAAESLNNTEAGTLTATATVTKNMLYSITDGTTQGDALENSSEYQESDAVTITSSDENIATVDENGKVTAKAFGTVTFTATSTGKGEDGQQKTAQYTLLISDSSKNEQSAPTNLEGTATTHYDLTDGSITGLSADSSYEYRLSTEANYTQVATGSTSIENLAPGTYQVRFPGDATNNPSPGAEVTITAGPKYNRDAPTGLGVVNVASESSENGQITGVTEEMEYAPYLSSIYKPITGTSIKGLKAGTYSVRYKSTDNYNVSEATSVTIKVVPAYVAPSAGAEQAGDVLGATEVVNNEDGSTTTTITADYGTKTTIHEATNGVTVTTGGC
jgi:hypothetical protein